METLLVIGSGSQAYREYAFKSLAEKYAIVLLQTSPLSWQKPFITDFIQIPALHEDSVLTAVHHVAGKHSLAGVFTYDEPSVEIANLVAQDLHLPHNERETIHACRDKFLMRQCWQQNNVPSAQSSLSFSLEEAQKAAAEIGFPVVVKPRSLGASIGVIRANSLEELGDAYRTASIPHPMFKNALAGILIEEYLDGPEISVESVVHDGQVQIAAITRKRTGLTPYFEEIGHIISPEEPLEAEKEVRKVVVAAHQALGITLGVTHAEVRLTSRGPKMVEINARVAGDFIPLLVSLTYHIDLTALGADVAAGKAPSLLTEQVLPNAAAIRFIYPDQDCRVNSLEVDRRLSNLTWINCVEWLVKPGDEVLLPPRQYVSRLGFVVVTGRSVAECDEHIQSALSYIHIQTAPLNH